MIEERNYVEEFKNLYEIKYADNLEYQKLNEQVFKEESPTSYVKYLMQYGLGTDYFITDYDILYLNSDRASSLLKYKNEKNVKYKNKALNWGNIHKEEGFTDDRGNSITDEEFKNQVYKKLRANFKNNRKFLQTPEQDIKQVVQDFIDKIHGRKSIKSSHRS